MDGTSEAASVKAAERWAGPTSPHEPPPGLPVIVEPSPTSEDPPRSPLAPVSQVNLKPAPSTESFAPPSDDETNHVLSVYRALDKLPGGVRGDGFVEGVELTREKRGASFAGRWQDATALSSDVDLREDELLQHTDRYGFFSPGAQQGAGSHRTAQLPSSAYDQMPSSSNSRLTTASSPADARPDRPASRRVRQREDERVDKWADMLDVAERDEGGNASRWRFDAEHVQGGENTSRVSETAQRRIYKGIPDRWRPAAWQAMLDLNAKASSYPSSLYSAEAPSQPPSPTRSVASSRSRFSLRRRQTSQRSVAPPLPTHQAMTPSRLAIKERQGETWSAAAARFAETEQHTSEQDVQIDLDVPRTISGHLFFHTRYGRGQRALFRVLHAFSLLCSDCGYCQGMGPIACTLLCYFEPERAYAALVRLHDGARYGLHEIFLPGFPGLGVLFGLQSRLMAHLMPPIAQLLEEHSIPPSMYAAKWYITLFYNVVPFETQLRIWDAFLLDGRDVLVLTALALIWGCRARLFSCGNDFEAIVETLTCFFVPQDDDALMRWIRKVGKRKDVRQRLATWSGDSTTTRF